MPAIGLPCTLAGGLNGHEEFSQGDWDSVGQQTHTGHLLGGAQNSFSGNTQRPAASVDSPALLPLRILGLRMENPGVLSGGLSRTPNPSEA